MKALPLHISLFFKAYPMSWFQPRSICSNVASVWASRHFVRASVSLEKSLPACANSTGSFHRRRLRSRVWEARPLGVLACLANLSNCRRQRCTPKSARLPNAQASRSTMNSSCRKAELCRPPHLAYAPIFHHRPITSTMPIAQNYKPITSRPTKAAAKTLTTKAKSPPSLQNTIVERP